VLGTLFKKESLLGTGKWTLYFGTLSAAMAVWTGLEAAKAAPHDGGSVHEILTIHRYLGYTVLALSMILSAWVCFSKAHIPTKGRVFFLIGFAILGLVLMQGADLGGRMVFLHGVGVGRKSMVQEAAPREHGG